MSSKKDILIRGLKNRDENMRLVKWMLQVVSPYYRYIFFVFMISVVSMVISYAGTIIGKYVVDDATSGDINFRNMAIMCATTLVSILFSVGSSILGSYISEKFSFTIRQQFYTDIQRSVWLRISKFHSGDLVTRLTSDIASLAEGMITLLPRTLLTFVQLLISFLILFYYDKSIALFALIIGPIGAVCLFFFRERYKKYQTALRECESDYRSFMQESLSSLTVMKTFRQETANEQRMEGLKQRRLDLILKNTALGSAMSAVLRIVYSAGYVITFCWGAYRISTGRITYGTLTIFITLVSQVQGSVSGLAGIIPQVYNMLISSKRITEVAGLEKEVYTGREDVPSKVGLEVRDVTFAYDREPVLRDLDFTVAPGEKIGVVGPSGAGKTTLVRMLLALTTPQSGEICYLTDGVPEAATPDVRRFISYVPQGNTLMTGTIADNLRIGLKDATREDMLRALTLASARDFVEALPDGLETVLSEKSGGISEGQAQRIAIARALIGDKPIVILDEATSALDEATESVILKSITDELKQKTCFIITHRRSMLQYCDRVLSLNEHGEMTMRAAPCKEEAEAEETETEEAD
ncbi:MAG: ABC transporter ATP-binding protein [Clostridia bacterium]|nr:ABC transporter ATP-binding protein [Clostridia bacterium]